MQSAASAEAPGLSLPPTPHLDALTGLRWFAAFAVFFFHARSFYPLPHSIDLAYFGNAGVTFFFVLSGFVLTWSFNPADTAAKFYWRRFARIWPALAVSTAIAIPVFYGLYGKPWDSVNQVGVFASLGLVQSWFPSLVFAGNPAAWSLSDEAFFYLLFPFLIRPLMKLRLRTLAALALSLVALHLTIKLSSFGWHPSTDQEEILFVSPIGRLGEFLVGMVTAAALRHGWRTRLRMPAAVGLVAVAVAVMWYSRTHTGFLAGIGLGGLLDDAANQILTPLFALLIAAVAVHDLSGRRTFLKSRPLVLLGQWSYSFYLVHATVLYAIAILWLPRHRAAWSNIWPATIAAVCAIAAAAALYYLVEHPAERALRRRLKSWPFVARTASGTLTASPAGSTPADVSSPRVADPVAAAEALVEPIAAHSPPQDDKPMAEPVGPI